MNHIHFAHAVCHQSHGAVLMSEFSLPDYQRELQEVVNEWIDDMNNDFGMYVIEVYDYAHDETLRRPLASVLGRRHDVMRTALCLHPVSKLYRKHRQRFEDFVSVVKVPTNHDFLSHTFKDQNDFMSFPEFVASKRENVSECNSSWTGNERDDADHIKGYFYGPENFRILLTFDDHTDLIGLSYQDWGYAEENETELEALAYRCYLHAKRVISDDELRKFFPLPLRARRESITY